MKNMRKLLSLLLIALLAVALLAGCGGNSSNSSSSEPAEEAEEEPAEEAEEPAEELAEEGVECIIVPRKELGGVPISASNVRKAIKEDRLSDIRELVPQSTYDYFASDEAVEVVNRIRKAEEVVHY